MSQTRASEPFTVRPATLDDAHDIVNLRNACAVERTGKPATNLRAVQGTMQMPGLDLERDTLLAHGPEGQLAGLALVQVNPPSPLIYALFEVHPRYWRTDIGRSLCRWVEGRAERSIPDLEAGARVVLLQQRLSTDAAGRDLLLADGYRVIRHNFRMVTELDDPPPPAPRACMKKPGCMSSAGTTRLKRNWAPASGRVACGAR